jgi:galactokinase
LQLKANYLFRMEFPDLAQAKEKIIVSSADGMLGSRFMGGGFGGCVVGFVKHDRAAAAAGDIRQAYCKLHPEVADQAMVYLANSADGIRFLSGSRPVDAC